MAFDFGLKRIGVAVGQSLLASAQALPTLSAEDGKPRWGEIERLLQQWQPDLLVVGHPINMDGSDNEITKLARKFARRLRGRFGIPCYIWDERLSSFAARERIRESEDKLRTGIDSVAAQIILESWLQEHPQAPKQDNLSGD